MWFLPAVRSGYYERVPAGAVDERARGVYNSYVLWVCVSGALALVGLCPGWLLAWQALSLGVAMLVDPAVSDAPLIRCARPREGRIHTQTFLSLAAWPRFLLSSTPTCT